MGQIAEGLAPEGDGLVYVEVLDPERLAQVRAVTAPIAGE